jgi:hypothetical protein
MHHCGVQSVSYVHTAAWHAGVLNFLILPNLLSNFPTRVVDGGFELLNSNASSKYTKLYQSVTLTYRVSKGILSSIQSLA